MIEIKEKLEKFVENREPGSILEKFDFECGGEKKKAILRYAKIEDHSDIVNVDKARWKERAELKDIPGISSEKLDKIRNDYKDKLKECEGRGLDFFSSNLKDLEDSFSEPQKPFFVVVDVDGKIIGYIEIGNNEQRDKQAIWVHTISLLPEYQGKGISQKLLARGIDEAKKEELLRDRKEIALGTHTWTPRAIGFWEKEGFKKVNQEKEEKDTFDPDSIKMSKQILY